MTAGKADERDPRTTPVAGDVLRRGNSTRTVLDVRAAVVRSGLRIQSTVGAVSVTWDGPKWRAWARTATIIRRGDTE